MHAQDRDFILSSIVLQYRIPRNTEANVQKLGRGRTDDTKESCLSASVPRCASIPLLTWQLVISHPVSHLCAHGPHDVHGAPLSQPRRPYLLVNLSGMMIVPSGLTHSHFQR
jgi:hypothetical protein